jgi:hypothetical protein
VNGRSSRVRTDDPPIKSRVLYQLSYGPMWYTYWAGYHPCHNPGGRVPDPTIFRGASSALLVSAFRFHWGSNIPLSGRHLG